MWPRLFWVFSLSGAVACTGLYLSNGNAYPCDFSQGPGVRDAVCLQGDVCGTNNLCQRFIYEGPRFEGAASLPEYGPDSGEGELLHPLALNQPVIAVSAGLPLSRGETYVQFAPGGPLSVVRFGHLAKATAHLPETLPVGFGALEKAQPFLSDLIGPPSVLLQSVTGKLALAELNANTAESINDSAGPFAAQGFRVVNLPPGNRPGDRITRATPIVWDELNWGEVGRQAGQWTFEAYPSSPGKVFDVAGLTQPERLWLVALTAEGLTLFDRNDGGISTLAALANLATDGGMLRTDPGNRIVAAIRRADAPGPRPDVTPDVLSTFQVNIGADGPHFTSPWPDCVPCPAGQRVELLTPSVNTGAPTVEVACLGAGFPSLVRVVGSVALTQLDACLTEEMLLPVSLTRVARAGSRLVQWDNQSGLLLGGRRGELWAGETISSLQPEFLDRVPRDVGPAFAGAIATIADDYLAVQQSTENQFPNEALNGFRRISARALALGEDTRLLGFVHGVSGWSVGSGGFVIRIRIGQGIAKAEVGPQLVTPEADPIRDSIGGEAFLAPDGGPSAFFLAADDSLYFATEPQATLEATSERQLLTPVLTPEPSVPIRSLALERTPLGTDGITRARGYLVTSRKVYSWALDGEPARWSSTELTLTGGEPLEVWFDQTLSALGRVGYRDGQIFSLPGGYQLAQALPASEGGISPQVLDYENIGGWPVAYATTGLFIAGWDQVDGKLQNRFPDGVNRPMTWREVKLEGNVRPWMRRLADGSEPRVAQTKPGKLFVSVEPRIANDRPYAGLQPYRLLLFVDDEVRQVARHLRK